MKRIEMLVADKKEEGGGGEKWWDGGERRMPDEFRGKEDV